MTVRTTRARIIWLKNDYKDIMNRIEKGLHEHHASMQAAGPPKDEGAGISAAPVAERHSEPVIETPFARVNSVESGSPAHEANLKAGDRIKAFGTVNWTNHENLRKLAEVVQRNEGVWNLFHYIKTLFGSLCTSDPYLSKS
jgi:26S proteasome non-ATPase regulatory subunit 9